MNSLAFALTLPILAGGVAWLTRGVHRLGGALAVAVGVIGLLACASLPTERTFPLAAGLALEWSSAIRLLVLALWAVLALFGALELARPGWSFVMPAVLVATGLTLFALTLRPLPLAFLAMQIGGLLIVFPALEGPARRPWGTLGYLVVTIMSGAIGLMGLSLAEFHAQNPDEATARLAAALFAVAAGLSLALIPLHFWLPRVTETAPFQVTAWLGIVGQLGILGLVLRLLTEYDWLLTVTPLIYTFILGGLASVILGGALALAAPTPRHWFAYAMIFSTGIAVVGFGLFVQQGAGGAALALVNRTLAILVATAGFRAVPNLATHWDDLRGMGRHVPPAGVALGVAAAAFAAFPPLAGFPAAWLIYRAAFDAAPVLAYLLAPGMVLIALSVFRLLVTLVEPGEGHARETPLGLSILIGGLTLGLIVLGLFPQLALGPIMSALATLRFLP